MGVTVFNYSDTVTTNQSIVNNAGTVFSAGQTFTVTQPFILSIGQVTLRMVGSPTGTLDLQIASVTGSVGSTAVPNTSLALSDPLNVSAVGGSYATYNFSFSGANAITMPAGDYAIIVRGDSVSGLGGNLIQAGWHDPSSDPGNAVNFTTSGGWVAQPGYDMLFTIFASEIITTQTQTGKSRITVVTDRTQTGKADIRATTDQTQTGKSLVAVAVLQTITGKGSIATPRTQTQTGKGNILGTTDRTQAGKSRVLNSNEHFSDRPAIAGIS